MTADIIPLRTTTPAVIRPGDRVCHRRTGEEGVVFIMTSEVARVAICGKLVTCNLAEWRPA